MQQRANLVNPRLHVEAASAVRHHDGLPEFYVGHVLDQLILKFRELEWPVITFTIMLVVCPHADNHRIVLGEVSRRLQRGPAQLNTQKTTNTAPGVLQRRCQKNPVPCGNPTPRYKHYQRLPETLQKTPQLAQNPTAATAET